MNIKVIGLDLDGTLYLDTPEIKHRHRSIIYEDISSFFGISLNESKNLFEGLYTQTCSGSKTIELIAKKYSKLVNGNTFMAEAISKVDILDLLREDQSIISLLDYLKNKFGLIDLITGREYNNSLKILKKLSIPKNLFDIILCSNGNYGKSNGSIYKKWLEFRKINPSLHFYIGDNRKTDIDIPKELGIKTCIIGDYKNADFRINNILELYKIL